MATATKTQVKPQKVMTLTGNEAVSWAARLARVPLTFFFPIGPSDEVGDTMGQFYAAGELQGKVMTMLDGEDNTVAALASAADHGVRTLFCTNSAGIKKGWPCLSSMGRIPVVIPDPHRMIFGGAGVSSDWMDSIIMRDVGWILLSAESSQECFDLMLQAYKIAEDPKVHLPIMVSYEGWEQSHSDERVLIPDQGDVDKFLPAYRGPNRFIETEWREHSRIRRGRTARMTEDSYPEGRYRTQQAMSIAKKMLDEVDKEYGDMFGRYWGGVLDTADCQNAEVVIVTMCALLGTARIAAEIARERGINAGVLKVRMYNPFPYTAIANALKTAKVVIALERDEVGVLYHGIRSALFSLGRRPKVLGRAVGLGGVSMSIEECLSFFEEGGQALKGKKVTELGWYLKGSRAAHGVYPIPAKT